MSISYEVVSLDSWAFQYGQAPSSATISDAIRYVSPTDWIVAVENGVMRNLTPDEEAEFQSALGHSPSWCAPIRVQQAEPGYEELKRKWEIICSR